MAALFETLTPALSARQVDAETRTGRRRRRKRRNRRRRGRRGTRT